MTSVDKTKAVGQVVLIPAEMIYPNPNQPRKYFNQEELVNLAISIRMNGILQPLTVRKTESGYELVAGERRLRASKLAGLVSVPCIVIDVNSLKSAVFSLIENLQRQNLNYFEEAVAIERLIKDYEISQEDIARRLGKAPSTVSNKLRLLSLPSEIKDTLLEKGLSERHARALLKVDEKNMGECLNTIISRKMNVSQTEEYIEDFLASQDKPRRNTKIMFSDVKIFIKSINNAVETMNKAGIKANVSREDTGDSYRYLIEIPKNNVYKVAPAAQKS